MQREIAEFRVKPQNSAGIECRGAFTTVCQESAPQADRRQASCAHRTPYTEGGDGTLAIVPELSVVLITLNEAANIDDALSSVAWADEIVVVDSGSTDDTVERARRHAAQVSHRDWTGFGTQKDHATSLASHDWVLSLDADERVSPELAGEIQALLAQDPPRRGYRIPRSTRYLDTWIRTTDWYPDYQLRLYDRRVAAWSSDRVHESVSVNGAVGALTGDIRHVPYRDLADHVATIDRYTTLAAGQLHDEGRRAHLAQLLTHPAAAFIRNYVLHRGCRQGVPGLIVSLMNSYYVFLKYAKLLELDRHEPDGGSRRQN